MKKPIPILAAMLLLAALVYLPRGSGGTTREMRFARIVSIVPSVTEMLFAVGAGDQVVGVTKYCTYPPEARMKEKVGDVAVDYEKVVSLRPDVVMTVRSMTRETSLALEKMGIPIVDAGAESFEEIAGQLRRIGRLTGHAERGEEEARRLMSRVRAVEDGARGRPQPTVFFEASPMPVWSAGPNSYAGDAIRRAGGRNIMDDLPKPWSAVSWEVVLKRDPDVILVAHPFMKLLESRAGWSDLKAVKTGRVYQVPHETFYFPTPRLVDGLELAVKLIHEKD